MLSKTLLIFYHKQILLSTSNLTFYLTGWKKEEIFLIDFIKEHLAIILVSPSLIESCHPVMAGNS